MRKAHHLMFSITCAVVVIISLAGTGYSQTRDRFIISARAGGINAVTGRASMHSRGVSEWQQLTIREDLESGDVVKTGADGRVEMLLNPGSYLRVGENSEFELANNSLDNLEVRLLRGTAIVEATGTDDMELLINITTPDAKLAIVRRGLYRVNVVPGDSTELIVRKGRVMLEGDSHTKIKGGNKVVFSSGSVSIAKLQKAEKKNADTIESWSKERADMVAKANAKMRRREISSLMLAVRDPFFTPRSSGFWVFNRAFGCYTFLPFFYGWGSPYGSSYSSAFYGNYWWRNGNLGNAGWGTGSGATGGSGTGSGSNPQPVRAPMPTRDVPSAAERKIDRLNDRIRNPR
jgi:FecR-like protein